MFGTLVDLIETLKFSKSRPSISSTNSTAAATSASTGASRSSSCRCLGSEPELTPIRIGTFRPVRPLGDLGDFVAAADVARVEPDAVGAGVDRFQRQGVVEVDVGDHRDRRLARRSSSAPRRPARAAPRTRTMSAPASATLRICSIVAARLAVSVLVIVWTTTGARRRSARRRRRSVAWKPCMKGIRTGPIWPGQRDVEAFAGEAADVVGEADEEQHQRPGRMPTMLARSITRSETGLPPRSFSTRPRRCGRRRAAGSATG